MASNWVYDATKHVFRNATTGRKLTPQQVVKIRDGFINDRELAARTLAERLASGEIMQSEFSTALRGLTAETMAAQQALGAGGWESLSKLTQGTQQLQALLDKQTPFMQQFMADIEAGTQSADQIAQRAALYQGASVQAYEQANAADAGIDSLPFYPGDWSTQCVADPNARVFTERGMVAISQVGIGDRVMTHMGRFKPVTAVITSPAIDRAYADLRVFGAPPVRFTTDHELFTPVGWVDTSRIMQRDLQVLSIRAVTSGQDESMSGLWSGLRSSCDPVYVMREQDQSTGQVGRSGQESAEHRSHTRDDGHQTYAIRGHHARRDELDDQAGWAAVCMVLGRGSQADDLSLPVGMDSGERTDPTGRPYSPHQRRQVRRSVGEPGAQDAISPFERSHDGRAEAEHGRSGRAQDDGTADTTVPDMWSGVPGETAIDTVLLEQVLREVTRDVGTGACVSEMWGGVPGANASWEVPEVLQSGVLPIGATLYDLTVEDDHSFVVEGIVAHNCVAGCRCSWEIETTFDGNDEVTTATWQTEQDGSVCPDCETRGNEWQNREISRVPRTDQEAAA